MVLATLLSAAALFSEEGHKQVLQALDDLKRTRRRIHRFGWLVEQCNRYQLDGDQFEPYQVGGSGLRGSNQSADDGGGTQESKQQQQAKQHSPLLPLSTHHWGGTASLVA